MLLADVQTSWSSACVHSDLLQIVQPFGAVAKLIMLHTKDQALVRMEDLASLVSTIQYYNYDST